MKITNNMTDEQFETLTKYENVFNAAINNNFLRVSHEDFTIIAAVYDKLFTPLRPSQRNCNTCRLNAIKSIGRAYFGEKENRAKQQAEKTNNSEAVKTNTFGETIKKVFKGGRPKKINLED